ncbi:MAG TPA: translational GTPase TypA [Polyangiaceae bacterium]|nr:translational GTPase TypA [Polyangiaceae bacterium]
MNIRNIAIIAHVDHGKTTLVDAMLRQTGVFRENEVVAERVMDSNDMERERGITITAKNASVTYKGTRINIVDTPGHADFGGEVERILKMADGALLLVDAAEGPLPQTRFVLDKALALGMPVIVVVNKIDRHDARAEDVVNEIFTLFCDLNASDAQSNFATIYAIGKDGVAGYALDDIAGNLDPLFETILKVVPEPKGDPNGPLQILVHNIQHDEYLGRLAVGRVHRGKVTTNQSVVLIQQDGNVPGRMAVLQGFDGPKRVRVNEVAAGDILSFSGFEDVQIGDTVASPEVPEALPRISVDDPTIKVRFTISDSPFAGKVGKWVTTRHLRERLHREARHNIALRVFDTDSPDTFEVFGRGELMLAVLAETMRREGYEFCVAMPEVVRREVNGVMCEPVERVTLDVNEEHMGTVAALLGERRGQMVGVINLTDVRRRLEYRVPSRGLLGFRSLFLTETRGTGLFNSIFDGWEPQPGPLMRRRNGSMVADRPGQTIPYALFHLQPRGVLFVGPGEPVYEGMIVGEHNRPNDLDVNVSKEKKLTNIRAAGRDENIIISTPRRHTIESALDHIDADELVELTPDAIRLRKRVLDKRTRPRRNEA